MLFAVIRDTPYNIVLLLHILAVMVAFAPAFAHPLISQQTNSIDAPNRSAVLNMLLANGRRIYAPALIVSGLLGFALQGMSDSVWSFSQTWMWMSLVVWIAMNGVFHGLLLPAEKAVANGNASAKSKADAGGGAITVLLLVMLYLMIFKPGI